MHKTFSMVSSIITMGLLLWIGSLMLSSKKIATPDGVVSQAASYGQYATSAKFSEVLSIVTRLKMEVEVYYQYNETWPESFEEAGIDEEALSEFRWIEAATMQDQTMYFELHESFGEHSVLALAASEMANGWGFSWQCEVNARKLKQTTGCPKNETLIFPTKNLEETPSIIASSLNTSAMSSTSAFLDLLGDLSPLKYEVENYYRKNQSMPATSNELRDSLVNLVPKDIAKSIEVEQGLIWIEASTRFHKPAKIKLTPQLKQSSSQIEWNCQTDLNLVYNHHCNYSELIAKK